MWCYLDELALKLVERSMTVFMLLFVVAVVLASVVILIAGTGAIIDHCQPGTTPAAVVAEDGP